MKGTSYEIQAEGKVQVNIVSCKLLRVILKESEAKLEMKNFNPPPPLQFLCGGRLPWGINKNNHICIGRFIVAIVTALDDVGLRTMF